MFRLIKWIILSLAYLGLGIFLITFSAINFIPEPFTVVKIVIGCLLTLGGIAMMCFSIKLFVLARMKNTLDKRKKINQEIEKRIEPKNKDTF